MRKLVTIAKAATLCGVTVRQLQNDLRDGLKPTRTGPRNVALFDPDLVLAWRAEHRRKVPGEGRPRKKDAPPPKAAGDLPPFLDFTEATLEQLAALVGNGQLGSGRVATYRAAVEAKARGLELRRRGGELVEKAAVEREALAVLERARGVIDELPDAMVRCVGAVVPLSDAQRLGVLAAARAEADRLLQALSRLA